MRTFQVSQMISNALAHDGYTGSLAQALAQRATLQGQWPDVAQIGHQVMFIRNYVQRVPQLLDQTRAAAEQAGWGEAIAPLLDAAEEYWVAPLDVIPDHLGLVGVTDDAYLSMSLLQAISDRHREATGYPLLPFELHEENAAIGVLIGEPHLNQLNSIVSASVTDLDNAISALNEYEETLPVADEPWLSDPTISPADAALLSGLHAEKQTQPAESSEPPEPVAEAAPEDDWRSGALDVFEVLMGQYRKEKSSGTISGTRQATLEPILEKLQGMLQSRPESLDDNIAEMQKMRDLMAAMSSSIESPSHAGDAPTANSRAERVDALLTRLKLFIFAEAQRAGSREEERAMAFDLYARCGRANTALRKRGDDDAAVVELESDSLRQLANEVRWFGMREHPMLATPAWPMPATHQDPNAVFYSGSDELMRPLSTVCGERKLRVSATVEHRNYSQGRWDQLRNCSMAVFDLAQNREPDRARTFYELGIALALGRPILLLARSDTVLPFDIHIEPLRLDEWDEAELGRGIDETLYGRQFGGAGNSVRKTIEYARSAFSDRSSNDLVQTLFNHVDQDSLFDPVKLRSWLGTLLGMVGPEGPKLLYPAWPGRYPERSDPTCFHVMPFSEAWSDDVRNIVASACEGKVRYVRGDAVEDERIIRSIWDSICAATHVLVDITGLNDNVLLELGLAHALGRRTLIVGQEKESIVQLFPSIAKRRVQPYSMTDGAQALTSALQRFINRID
jgi:uncharacterized membrane protein YkvA (DUF1232 family)